MLCSILVAEENELFNLSNSICLRKQSRTFVPVILDDHMEMDELDSQQNSPEACDEFSDKAVVRSYNIVKIKLIDIINTYLVSFRNLAGSYSHIRANLGFTPEGFGGP